MKKVHKQTVAQTTKQICKGQATCKNIVNKPVNKQTSSRQIGRHMCVPGIGLELACNRGSYGGISLKRD